MVDPGVNSGAGGRVLALVPAKGSSRRLPGKNLKPLAGRSLLAWTLTAALEAGVFARVVVSTEDPEVAAEARRLGAEVPFLRPAHLARDPAGIVDVTLHALEVLAEQGLAFDAVAVLQPTTPFRTADDLRAALALYARTGSQSLLSVTRATPSPLRALVRSSEGFLTPLHPEWIARLGAKAAGHELPDLVQDNGAITIANVARFRQEKSFYCDPLAAYEMPWERSLDIDTEADFALATFLLDRARTTGGG